MSEITTTYEQRNAIRQLKMNDATVSFIEYFISLGDDLPTAENKVSQVSTETSLHLFPYVLGNTQPLLDAIQESTLPFMDQNAKDALISQLL